MKQVLLSSVFLLIFTLSATVSAEYKEVSCSESEVFAENSCTQCFDGGSKSEGSNLGLLTDIWSNGTSKAMYMLKWENSLESAVKMISLNWAAWSYEPTKDNFWEYTTNLETLPNDEWFYTLEPKKSIDWIQSKLGYSIRLNKSPEAGKGAGLLKYILNVHIDDNGVPAEATTSHSECVLFKSAEASLTPEESPKDLPETWPQEILLLLLALLLSGLLFFASKKRI